MINPNGESGSTGDSGIGASLETRIGDQPKLLARLLSASGAERFIP